MPDDIVLNAGAGGETLATDQIGIVHHQLIKIEFGAPDAAIQVQTSAPLPVRIGDGTDQIEVTAAGELNVIATAQPGTDIGDVTINNGAAGAAVNVQDGGNSLTVDAPAGTPVATRPSDGAAFYDLPEGILEAGSQGRLAVIAGEFDDAAAFNPAEDQVAALRITVERSLHVELRSATGEIGVVGTPLRIDPTGATAQPVTDDGGALTVDAANDGSLVVQIGDGTDLALVTAAGELNVLSAAQPGVDVGDVTVNNGAGAGAVNVQDGGNSLTVDAPVATPVAVRISDGAAFYELAVGVAEGAAPGARLEVMAAEFDDVATVVATEDNVSPLRVTAQRGLHANLRNTAGTEVGTAGAPLRTDPTGATTQPVSDAGGALTVDAANDGSLVVQLGDGTDLALITAAGDLQVTLAGETVTVAGTVTVDDITTSMTPGVAAGNLGKAESATHGSGDTGIAVWGVRSDAGAALAADGEYIPFMMDATGRLRVVTQGGAGGTSSVDDALFTVAVDSGTPAMGLFDDATPDSVDEDDVGVLRMSQNRVLYSTLRDAAGAERGVNVTAANELNVLASAQPGTDIGDVTINNAGAGAAVNIQDGGNIITVDGTVIVSTITTSIVPGVAPTHLGKAESSTHVSGDTGVAVWGVRNDAGGALAADGEYIPFLMDSTGRLRVVTQGGAGGTSSVDDALFTVAVDSGTPAMGLFDDATPDSVDEDDVGVLRMSANRVLYGTLRDAAGAERGANVTASNELNVLSTAQPSVDIGDVTINNAGAGAAVNIQDGGNSITVDAPVATPVAVRISDGAAFYELAVGVAENAVPGARIQVMGAEMDDTGTVVATEDDVSALRLTTERSLHVELRSAAGETGIAATPLQVQLGDGTDQALVTAAGELNVIATAQPGVDIGDVTITNASLTVDAANDGTLNVQIGDGTDTALVTAAGELNVLATAQPGVDIGDVTVTNGAADPAGVRISDGAAFYELAVGAAEGAAQPARFQVIAGELDDAASFSPAEDQVASVRITPERSFHVELRSGTGEIGVAGTPLRVDPTGTTTQPVDDASGSLTVDALNDGSLNVQIGDGTDTALVTAAGELNVLATAQPGVDIGDITVNNPAGASAVFVQGQAANDAPLLGNPLVVGLRFDSTEPASVGTDGDAVTAWGDEKGRQVVSLNSAAQEIAAAVHGPQVSNVSASGTTELIATPGASNHLKIFGIWMTNQDASTSISCAVRPAVGGTDFMRGRLAADGGGAVMQFHPAIRLATNVALVANLGAAGDVDITVHFAAEAD